MYSFKRGDVYLTTFCNHPHDLATGKPVNHECYILKPHLLQMEFEQSASAVLTYMKEAGEISFHTGRLHRGLRR